MKNQKGITLIALVITIIVLLILAGVSIAMLTGQNGILTQANSAKSETSKAEAVERINLTLNAVKAKIYEKQVTSSTYSPLDNSGTNGLQSDIATVLTNDGVVYTSSDNNGKYVYSLSSNVLTISYYNTATNVGTSEVPIKGTIDLSASPYTITAAK